MTGRKPEGPTTVKNEKAEVWLVAPALKWFGSVHNHTYLLAL